MLKKIFKTRRTRIATAAVLALAIIIFGKELYVLAASVVDSFLDETKVADTWNVTVDTGAGEVKLSEKSCDAGTWFCDEDETCINSLGDGDYILVKLVNESTAQWKTTQTACDMPECGIDGGQDGDNLAADNTVNFSDYPARQACKAAGGRLPTIAELQCIYTNRVTFGDNFGTSYYWSSTEYSETLARLVNFSTGSPGTSTKTGTNSVRCVRGW